jgi:urease beta subunit
VVDRASARVVRRGAMCVLTAAAMLGPVPIEASAARPPAAAAPLPSISVNDVTVTEGDAGTVSATFTITQDIRGRSRVSYHTVDGTATSPGDYAARSGRLRFAGNRRTHTVSIAVQGDTSFEGDETFSLELTNPVDATIADGEGVGTITNDDPPPTVSVAASLSVPEGDAGDQPVASIDITLSPASGRSASVDYATADGTATAGSDYVAAAGTIDFAPGEVQKTLLVTVTGDNSTEGDEAFDVNLSNPVRAALGNATETVTIVDNDPIPPGSAVLDISGASVREDQSGTTTLSFTVTRSGNTTTAVNANFATTNGTASDPGDYAAASGNVAFGVGEITKTIDVTVNGDRALEHDEDLFVSLLNPSVGAAIATGQATGTIVNDDTRTRLSVRRGRTLRAHGLLSPARPRKHMVVKLFRRRSGSWVRLKRKRASLLGHADRNGDGFTDSTYVAKFARPKPGHCEVIASYPGDTRFHASRATKRFRC